jgi:hypothetical protein
LGILTKNANNYLAKILLADVKSLVVGTLHDHNFDGGKKLFLPYEYIYLMLTNGVCCWYYAFYIMVKTILKIYTE